MYNNVSLVLVFSLSLLSGAVPTLPGGGVGERLAGECYHAEGL